MKVAILGAGTIGKLLAGWFSEAGAAECVALANRSAERFSSLIPAERVEFGCDFTVATRDARVVCLAIPPLVTCEVLSSLAAAAEPQAILVSTAADVALELLRAFWKGPILRVLPTVTTQTSGGISLVTGDTEAWKTVRRWLPARLQFRWATEVQFDVLSSVTSCGPGLVAALLKTWCDELVHRSGLDSLEAETLVMHTAKAALDWMSATQQSLAQSLGQVATPTGVTGRGAAVIDGMAPALWKQVSDVMQARHHERQAEVLRLSLAVLDEAGDGRDDVLAIGPVKQG